MKNLFVVFITLLCSISFCSCGDKNEEDISVVGTWNAISLVEDVVFTDLNKEEHNSFDICYGNYLWKLGYNGDAKITGNDGGDYQWYNEGENPTEYDNYIWDKKQMKLLMGYSDISKSYAVYDILELSDNVMMLRYSARWLNVGDGEILITKTLRFSRVK